MAKEIECIIESAELTMDKKGFLKIGLYITKGNLMEIINSINYKDKAKLILKNEN